MKVIITKEMIEEDRANQRKDPQQFTSRASNCVVACAVNNMLLPGYRVGVTLCYFVLYKGPVGADYSEFEHVKDIPQYSKELSDVISLADYAIYPIEKDEYILDLNIPEKYLKEEFRNAGIANSTSL